MQRKHDKQQAAVDAAVLRIEQLEAAGREGQVEEDSVIEEHQGDRALRHQLAAVAAARATTLRSCGFVGV